MRLIACRLARLLNSSVSNPLDSNFDNLSTMTINLRMQLSWPFYWTASGAATYFDLPPGDWYGMYCAYSL